MPKKDWTPPEKRKRYGINLLQAERQKIEASADQAGLDPAVFIREAALGCVVTGKRRAVTIDAIRASAMVMAINDAGARLQRLIEILEENEDPRADHWHGLHEKLEAAIELHGKVMRGEP